MNLVSMTREEVQQNLDEIKLTIRGLRERRLKEFSSGRDPSKYSQQISGLIGEMYEYEIYLITNFPEARRGKNA